MLSPILGPSLPIRGKLPSHGLAMSTMPRQPPCLTQRGRDLDTITQSIRSILFTLLLNRSKLPNQAQRLSFNPCLAECRMDHLWTVIIRVRQCVIPSLQLAQTSYRREPVARHPFGCRPMDDTAPMLCSEEEENTGTCPCTLHLTTMAGNDKQLVVPVSIHHSWEMLEDYLVEHLPMVARLDTFVCELTLLGADTNLALCDPIHDELWNSMRFHLVVQDCFQSYSCKEQIQRDTPC